MRSASSPHTRRRIQSLSWTPASLATVESSLATYSAREQFSPNPELNREILADEGKSFTCIYPSSIVSLLGPHSLLLTPVGPQHQKFHLLILTHFESAVALRDSLYLMRDIDRLVKSSMAAWEEGRPVWLLEQAKKITFELTVKQQMSEGLGELMEELRRHYLLVIDGFFSIAH